MLSSVEMSRLTMAGSIGELDGALRLCADLGNIHLTPYSADTDGISVGTPHPDADDVSILLSKVRSAIAVLSCSNKEGPISAKIVKQALSGKFPGDLDSISSIIENKNNADAEISRLEERVSILSVIAPLNVPLELMTELASVEVYLGETSKARKAHQVFGELSSRIEIHVAGNVIAVACAGKEAAEVQMAMGELNAKPIQIPSGRGTPSELLKGAAKDISKNQKIVSDCDSKMESWVQNNGRMLLAVQEHLERESEVLTGHTLCATSSHAYALEAWLPTSEADHARSVLSKACSHLKIEEFVEDHGHGDHEHNHETEYPPVEYDTLAITRHASLLTNLVGRPKYGSIDPTSMLAFTFPIFYGLILGDAGNNAPGIVPKVKDGA